MLLGSFWLRPATATNALRSGAKRQAARRYEGRPVSAMRRLRWRDSNKQRARKARVVGGPNNGLLVPVKEKDGDFVYSDVLDVSDYVFDSEAWEFRYAPPSVDR
jgi:hypothetical protein